MATKSSSEAERVRLNTRRTARREGVHPQTIRAWVKRGSFPAPHFIGERCYWFLDELEQWEREQMARPPEARRGAKNLHGGAEA